MLLGCAKIIVALPMVGLLTELILNHSVPIFAMSWVSKLLIENRGISVTAVSTSARIVVASADFWT